MVERVSVTKNVKVMQGRATVQFLAGRDYEVDADTKARLKRAGGLGPVEAEASTGEGDSTSPESVGSKPVEDMTKAELIAYAKASDIEIDESANKATILETIQTDPASA